MCGAAGVLQLLTRGGGRWRSRVIFGRRGGGRPESVGLASKDRVSVVVRRLLRERKLSKEPEKVAGGGTRIESYTAWRQYGQ